MKKMIVITLVLASLALFLAGCQSGGQAIGGVGQCPEVPALDTLYPEPESKTEAELKCQQRCQEQCTDPMHPDCQCEKSEVVTKNQKCPTTSISLLYVEPGERREYCFRKAKEKCDSLGCGHPNYNVLETSCEFTCYRPLYFCKNTCKGKGEKAAATLISETAETLVRDMPNNKGVEISSADPGNLRALLKKLLGISVAPPEEQPTETYTVNCYGPGGGEGCEVHKGTIASETLDFTHDGRTWRLHDAVLDSETASPNKRYTIQISAEELKVYTPIFSSPGVFVPTGEIRWVWARRLPEADPEWIWV